IAVGTFPIDVAMAPFSGCGDGFVSLGEQCDDGELNGTLSSCCSGMCAIRADGTSCDDGVFCNGGDTCLAGICTVHGGDPCADGPQCNTQCNEASHTCLNPYGTSCNTGLGITCSIPDFCDGNGTCVSGGGGDPDGDHVCSANDNCPSVPNTDQKD